MDEVTRRPIRRSKERPRDSYGPGEGEEAGYREVIL